MYRIWGFRTIFLFLSQFEYSDKQYIEFFLNKVLIVSFKHLVVSTLQRIPFSLLNSKKIAFYHQLQIIPILKANFKVKLLVNISINWYVQTPRKSSTNIDIIETSVADKRRTMTNDKEIYNKYT